MKRSIGTVLETLYMCDSYAAHLIVLASPESVLPLSCNNTVIYLSCPKHCVFTNFMHKKFQLSLHKRISYTCVQ